MIGFILDQNKTIFTRNTKQATENWFCNKIAVQAKFVSNRLSLILNKSLKIGSVIRSWFRLKVHLKWTFSVWVRLFEINFPVEIDFFQIKQTFSVQTDFKNWFYNKITLQAKNYIQKKIVLQSSHLQSNWCFQGICSSF